MSATVRIDVVPATPGPDHHLAAEARLLGLGHLHDLRRSRYYLLRGEVSAAQAERLAGFLADPVTERWSLTAPASQGRRVVEVQRRTGVMDPVEASVIKGAKDLGVRLELVRVGLRVEVAGASDADCQTLAWKNLANQAIEEVAIDPAEPVRLKAPGGHSGAIREEIPLAGLDDKALLKISSDGCLSLTLDEMKGIQAHYAAQGRAPTLTELETIAQTWSEHCVHKTLKGLVDYEGPEGRVLIDNLLKQTIAKATAELNPSWCWSVFKDNSGVIEFDGDLGVCIKVETHNRPSAIEPYGGANTGLGGVIRDIIGTGIGAKPIANTDVFCFAPIDLDPAAVPQGCIHPRRLMKGVVSGVRDYGNRMGIPTVNGAIRFDERFVGNPLVFCGTIGLIERKHVEKGARVGDALVVIGGRTGRDGIHGATFSSAELHDKSEVVSSGAVQIGNAIEEKMTMDVVLACRDAGCFSALTDCGAGGLSSACGEIGAELGARVDLDTVPLKYAGLSPTEIWISESQERMVATVPQDRVAEVIRICAAENVEAVAIGVITGDHRLVLRWHGQVIADMDMAFLHDGVPRLRRPAKFAAKTEAAALPPKPADQAATLRAMLGRFNIASKEWVIRQYDHEVQAGSIVKPLVGAAHDGPSDAAVVAPIPGSDRGIAIGCGLNTNYSDHDAYWSAAAGIEEALRNIVCVGAPIERVAILDNFSWAKCTDPEVFGHLVRACQACKDFALYYGTPFVSGKDSLSNEFVVAGRTIKIPHTLLITALTVVPDVRRSITMDVKKAGDAVVVVGMTKNELGNSEYFAMTGTAGGITPRVSRFLSLPTLRACAAAIATGAVTAAHDCSEGGLGVTLAEMAFAGGLGMDLDLGKCPALDLDRMDMLLYSESQSRIVLTVDPARLATVQAILAGVPHAVLGTVTAEPVLALRAGPESLRADLASLKTAWQQPLSVMKT